MKHIIIFFATAIIYALFVIIAVNKQHRFDTEPNGARKNEILMNIIIPVTAAGGAVLILSFINTVLFLIKLAVKFHFIS